MSEKYLTRPEAIKKYNLNVSRFEYAIRDRAKNGLYKAIYRVRSKIFIRQDFFEKWLEENDLISSTDRRKGEKSSPSSLQAIRRKERSKGAPRKGIKGSW